MVKQKCTRGCLCFDDEKVYNEFVQELHGKISPQRQMQLQKTRKLIAKYAYLLDDFEVEH